jgi:hypothetical protein
VTAVKARGYPAYLAPAATKIADCGLPAATPACPRAGNLPRLADLS